MAELVLENICKRYFNGRGKPETYAVKDFCIRIADKEFIVLVGPSGCGKSTTLQMIAGLEKVSSGEIYLDGQLINETHPKDRDIAMVFQSYALYPHMNVYDNMAFSLKMQKKKKQEIDKRVRTAAEILGITSYLKRMPNKLSGGERQRVAIGRAIVRNPKVFLMDEPLSNLDAKLRNQMRTEIKRLHKQLDTTFVYVTHDQTEALTLGDRIVVMKDGVIQQIGTPREVFDYPANVFVAGFIGTPPMNLITGNIRMNVEGMYCLELGQHNLPVSDIIQRKLLHSGFAKSSEVVIGFRPEHTSVYWNRVDNAICSSVEISEMMGSEMQIHVKMKSFDVVLRVPILSVPKNFREGIPTGTRVYFRISKEYLRLFDVESGDNIIKYD